MICYFLFSWSFLSSIIRWRVSIDCCAACWSFNAYYL